MRQLFGTDGIRGQANTYPIVPEVALQLGKAIARVLDGTGTTRKRALIGKDTRLSGYMLETALTSGLVSNGMDVYLVGPLPTPAVAHLTRSMNATVGICLTASHNPFDDNGIKIFDAHGYKLSDSIEEEIEELVLSGALATDHIRTHDLGKAVRIEDARGRYIEFAKNSIDNQSLEGLKIVLDCSNGAAYQIGPWIFRELGAEVIKTGVEPNGYNINVDCGALHPEAIGSLVREHQANVGIAFDGDADRVVFCDHEGRLVDGDRILALMASDLHDRGKLAQDTLVVTSISNLGLYESMREMGIHVETTAVGDRYVIEKMRRGGYNLGGEKSGHIICGDHATTGDGIIAALQVLSLMTRSQLSLSELSSCMTEYPQEMVSISVREKLPFEKVPDFQRIVQECETRLNGSGRVLVRYSGTEPKVRILVEARQRDLVDEWIGTLSGAAQASLGNGTSHREK